MSQDQFYYGVRRHVSADVHGQPLYNEVPLRAADFLNPTADDIFEQGPIHDRDVDRLQRIFQAHYRHNLLTAVYAKVKIKWAAPDLDDSGLDGTGLDQPRPDIIIATVDQTVTPQPRLHENTYSVSEWRHPPSTIIEVVAPRFAEADLTQKVAIYAKGGVQEYFIVDSGLRDGKDSVHYSIYGYQLDGSTYEPIPSDTSGMVISKVNHVSIGPSKDRSDFVVIDNHAGSPIKGEDVAETDRIAEVHGNSRASDIGAALDFLTQE